MNDQHIEQYPYVVPVKRVENGIIINEDVFASYEELLE